MVMCNQSLRVRSNTMEFGSIEREVRIEASPEIVFDVISSAEHIRDWWRAASSQAARR